MAFNTWIWKRQGRGHSHLPWEDGGLEAYFKKGKHRDPQAAGAAALRIIPRPSIKLQKLPVLHFMHKRFYAEAKNLPLSPFFPQHHLPPCKSESLYSFLPGQSFYHRHLFTRCCRTKETVRLSVPYAQTKL